MPLGISKFAASYVRRRTTDRMEDECRIYRPGEMEIDPVTKKAKRGNPEVKYEGPCRFWEVQAGTPSVIGDQQLTVSTAYLSLPFNSYVPEQDDIVLITKSVDSDLVDRTVQVISVVRGGGLRASRRFQVRLVDSQKASW